jgi:hypothetical protein
MRISKFPSGPLMAVMLLAGSAAWAHHSDAGFDGAKTVSVKGTLKMFAWSAPHSEVIVLFKNEQGEEKEIDISTVSPAVLMRQGLKPKDFRRGDQVEVFYHPARDGSLSGLMVKLVGADGKTLTGGPLTGITPPGGPSGSEPTP